MSSSSPLTRPYSAYTTPPTLVAFTFAVLVMCFVCFSVLYFCRCYFVSVIHTWAFHRAASGTIVRLSPSTNDTAASPFRGLDPSLLEAYPTFPYSSVKERQRRCGLECAICLLEFDDHSMLRLLTVCCHVFHQECIDLWLRSHKTCPVCRTDLDSVTDGAGGAEACVVDVKEAGEEGGGERFPRSHSTGHSIVMVRDGDGGGGGGDHNNRYTLRLQENWVRGGHKYTKSCSSYREMATMPPPPPPSCHCAPLVSGCSSIVIGGSTDNV